MSSKLTELTELTSPANDDIFYIVDDPGGNPVGKKITRANLLSGYLTDAPSDGSYYARKDGAWAAVPSGISIGDTITGGTANSILYVDSGGNLAEANPGLTYDGYLHIYRAADEVLRLERPGSGTCNIFTDYYRNPAGSPVFIGRFGYFATAPGSGFGMQDTNSYNTWRIVFAPGGGVSGSEFRLYDEDGSNYFGFQAPATISSDVTLKLPTSLTTDGILYSDSGATLSQSSKFTYDGATLTFTMGATDLTAITIDGATNPLTSESGKPIDIDRTLQRTTASGAISRQESLIDLDVSVLDNDNVTSGKSNVITYYVFDERVARVQTISGNTAVNYANYVQYVGVPDATGLTITNSNAVTESVAGGTSWITCKTILNNASLQYTGVFTGFYGYVAPSITNTASASKTATAYGVRGYAGKGGTVLLDAGYGGHFQAVNNTLNYGVYAEGATAALYAKGHLLFDADDTYDIGASAGNYVSEIYQKGHHYHKATSAKSYWGASNNSSICHDGTDWVFYPRESGTALMSVNGQVKIHSGTPAPYAATSALSIGNTISAAGKVCGVDYEGSFTSTGDYAIGQMFNPTLQCKNGYITIAAQYAHVANIPSGYTSQAWNLFVQNPSKTGSGTLSTAVGLYVNAVSSGSTNWQVYSSGGGHWRMGGDNAKTYYGDSQDGYISYTGSVMVINPKNVGSAILDVLGTLQTDGYNSADGSAGITDSFLDADGNTITVKNGLITAKTAP